MRTSKKRRRPSTGFTLVEVLLVLVILVVIASLGIANYSRSHRKALINAARAQVQELTVVLEQYHVDGNEYPTGPDGLGCLIQPPPDLANPTKWNGPYLKKPALPLDPWDRPFKYQYPSAHGQDVPDVWSTGPDGVDSEDDIGNWQ